MARKKWKNQTPEEREKRQNNRDIQETETRKYKFSSKRIMEIYDKGEIPIICDKHGYFYPEIYEIITMKGMLADKTINIVGKCPTCERRMRKPFPHHHIEMAMLNITLSSLIMKNRTIDWRGKMDECPWWKEGAEWRA